MNQKQFLSKANKSVKSIDVPGWDEPVHIKKMSLGDRLNIMRQHKAEDIAEQSVIVWCSGICDETGNPLFRYPEDKDKLKSMDPESMDFILAEIVDFNGLNKDAVDNAEKN